MKRRYFGTDGVRGPFGGPVINEDFAFRLGVAAGEWLRSTPAGRQDNPLVVVGRDPRFSGPALEAALVAGFAHCGVRLGVLGVVPTPAVSLAVRHFQAAMGAVITASHNPASDNGIKFFSSTGVKLADEDEVAIELRLPEPGKALAGDPSLIRPECVDAAEEYVRRLSLLLPEGALKGWKVVLDAANGAAFRTSPEVLSNLGAEVMCIATEPDGHNINDGVGSLHPGLMSERVTVEGARIGIAHDGDADRVILCDETGAVLDGDEIMAIVATHALRQGTLKHRTLVATQQSNLGLKVCLEKLGGKLVQTAIGDRYVVEAMLAGGYNMGGESSGHLIFSDISPSGDGLLAALKAIEVMLETGKPLSELRRILVKMPQLARALTVESKPALEGLAKLQAEIRAIEETLGDRGRLLLRYSGTEPKIRLLVEGPDEATTTAQMDRLEAAVRASIPVI